MNNLLNLALLEALENENDRNYEKLKRRILRVRSDPFQLTNVAFHKYFHVSKETTRNLITALRGYFPPARRATAIPLELKVLAALAFFRSGSYQKCVALNLNVPLEQSTFSSILHEIIESIVHHLLPQWIRFPRTEEEFNAVKQRFTDKFNFPGVIGAIDCTHVAIIAPKTNDEVRPGIAYYNRKGFYSINVQMICDANLKILNCNARFLGAVHDSAIWEMSPVKQFLEEKYILGELNSAWLIGDSGYPLQPWLLTPIENVDANTPEGRYTEAHIRSRNCIERCFGVLKQKFRCLLKHRVLHYDPTTAGKIIYSCAVLHNMSLQDRLEDEYEMDEYEQNENEQNVLGNQVDEEIHYNWLVEGRRIRNEIVNQYFNQM